MRVHVLQVAYDDAEPVAERRDRVAALVTEQRDADLVVLPELWAAGAFAHRRWEERSETVHGPGSPTVTAIAEAARAAGATVHAGSIVERPAGSGPTTSRWNTSVLIAPDGAVLATYRKIHLFGLGGPADRPSGGGEAALLEPGTDVVTARVPVAENDDLPVAGLATCYDLRFPELFRALVDAGAHLAVVPAAWPAVRVGHWSLLARARAVEDQLVVVAANTAGTHAGQRMGGRSVVVDALGEVLAEAGDGEEVLVADVDLVDLARARADFPVLADRRM